MPFSNYKNLGTAVKTWQVTYQEADFLQEIPLAIPDYVREDIGILLRDGTFNNSEDAICESLIFPILKEVWKVYRRQLLLWSHQNLYYDAELSGIADYLVTARSPLGKVVCEQPYVAVAEAKKEGDFETAWAQCLAEMVAAQRLNSAPELTIFGIVSNGSIWQFGQLQERAFTRHERPYLIHDLEPLFAAVNFIFQHCCQQLAHQDSP